jgi:hypothetical protein
MYAVPLDKTGTTRNEVGLDDFYIVGSDSGTRAVKSYTSPRRS